jgi:hypothetical protein
MPMLTRWLGVTETAAERNLAVEQAYSDAILEKVLLMQASAAAKQHRPLCRGTHAKGIIVRARFEILDIATNHDPQLAARLAQGIFARPDVYAATVRFANSDSCVNSDFKGDIRALSFSVDLTSAASGIPVAGVERQDFTLQSAATLPLNDAPAFLATMQVITASKPARALWSLAFRDKLRVIRALTLAELQARQPIQPYQNLRYWSTVPFRHGPADVAKHSLTPAADNPARPLAKNHPDAMQDELARHINDDPAMSNFDFGIQLLDADKMTYWGKRRDADFWIENASVRWKETESPFHTVARLTLLPRSHLSADASDATYFDVTDHSTAESRPLGSINRARCPSEVASRQARISAAP